MIWDNLLIYQQKTLNSLTISCKTIPHKADRNSRDIGRDSKQACRCLQHPKADPIPSPRVSSQSRHGRVSKGCDPRMADSRICKSLITGDPPESHSPPIGDAAMHRLPFPNVSRQRRSVSPPGPAPTGSAWHGRPDSTESGRDPGIVGKCHEKSAIRESLPYQNADD